MGSPERLIDDIGVVVEEVTGLSIRTTPEFIDYTKKIGREIRNTEDVARFIERFYERIEILLNREKWQN